MTPQDQWLAQKERILAWFRIGFAIVAVLVIQINPSRVARFPLLSQVSLGTFLAYSVGILYLVQRHRRAMGILGFIIVCLDLVCVSLIVFSTGGAATPFFVYYFFPIITAGARYGIKGGLAVALAGIVSYGYIRFNFEWAGLLGIDRFVIRSIYLVVLAYFFGFLSEFERKQNQKLLALSKTAGEVAKMVERRRIAQDVHDGLLQSLATLILRLETCRRQFLESPKDLDVEFRAIEDDTRSTMTVIRQFLAGKETPPLQAGMLMEALRDDLKFLRDGLGMRVIIETEPDDLNLSPAVEQQLYLVLREGLTNVARHSHASQADVTLKQTEANIQGAVSDNGVGFDPAEVGNQLGLGLSSMRERIEKLGGELDIQSSPGKGARISFVLPLVTGNGRA